MRELFNTLDPAAKAQQVSEQKKTLLVGTIKPQKGHTCFEFNLSTGEIKPAIIQEVNSTLKGAVRKKVMVNENCIYTSALNKLNAQRKFLQALQKPNHE